MFISRSAKVATAVAALALTLPVAANAATTVGSVSGSAVQNTSVCPDEAGCTLLGDNATVASAGVVTGWHIKSGSIGGEVRLRVLRPAGGGKYTGAGTGAPWKITRDDPYVNDFPDRLPVKAGDVLAVDNTSNALFLSTDSGTVKAFTPSVADGATVAPTANEPGARRVLMSADIEPDTDGDGYGDETQDACPAAGDRHLAPCSGAQGDISVEQSISAYTGSRRAMDLTLKVSNKGPAAATNVVLSDIELSGATVTAKDPGCQDATGPTGVYIKCPVGTLAKGASKTFTLSLAASDAKVTELTNRVVAFAAEGDTYPADNSSRRTFAWAPALTAAKVPLDAPKFIVAGREDLLRSVHVLYTLNQRATMTLTVRRGDFRDEARFTGYPGLNAQRDLFVRNGQLGGLKPGVYVATLSASAANLDSATRKFKFKVFATRPA
jgi:Domain of unknown function DUF11